MKLYDVIRKEGIERGTPLKEISKDDLNPHHDHHRDSHKPTNIRRFIIIGLALLFLVILYITGMKVARAKVVITERHIPFSLEGVEFELVHEENATGERLAFQTMIVTTEVARQVYGSEIQPSSSSAKGKVVFFNEYSTKAQTVKSGTTVTGTNGKTYKTQAAVTVPGYTTKNKVKTAGTSTSVAVVATGVGESYNTTGTTFKVAGWSNAKTFYAQSAGAIVGGESGASHTVSEAEKPDIIATLQAQLIERLKRETRSQIPEQLIAFPDLQVTTIESDSITLRGDSIKFPARIAGTMVSYLIPRKLLETAIAQEALSGHTYATVSIPALGDIVVEPLTALPTDAKNVPETIKIKVSGKGTIITKAPVEHIREALIGSPKRDFARILQGVPEVDTAQYHFYPFWALFFPTKDGRITVEVN